MTNTSSINLNLNVNVNGKAYYGLVPIARHQVHLHWAIFKIDALCRSLQPKQVLSLQPDQSFASHDIPPRRCALDEHTFGNLNTGCVDALGLWLAMCAWLQCHGWWTSYRETQELRWKIMDCCERCMLSSSHCTNKLAAQASTKQTQMYTLHRIKHYDLKMNEQIIVMTAKLSYIPMISHTCGNAVWTQNYHLEAHGILEEDIVVLADSKVMRVEEGLVHGKLLACHLLPILIKLVYVNGHFRPCQRLDLAACEDLCLLMHTMIYTLQSDTTCHLHNVWGALQPITHTICQANARYEADPNAAAYFA